MADITVLVAQATLLYKRLDAEIAPPFLKFLRDSGDTEPTSNLLTHLPFVASPTPFVLFMALYFGVLAVCYPLIAWLNRPKTADGMLMRAFMRFHNLFLAGLSLWMGVNMIYYWYSLGYPVWGVAFDPVRDKGIAFVMWVFYVSKYYEFFDTFIMLMKGNLNQVSFLHVFHHASTCFIFWWVCNKAPGGDAYFCITLNCWVHVVMYTYYLLTSIISDEVTRKKYLWWGVYLTQFQVSR